MYLFVCFIWGKNWLKKKSGRHSKLHSKLHQKLWIKKKPSAQPNIIQLSYWRSLFSHIKQFVDADLKACTNWRMFTENTNHLHLKQYSVSCVLSLQAFSLLLLTKSSEWWFVRHRCGSETFLFKLKPHFYQNANTCSLLPHSNELPSVWTSPANCAPCALSSAPKYYTANANFKVRKIPNFQSAASAGHCNGTKIQSAVCCMQMYRTGCNKLI